MPETATTTPPACQLLTVKDVARLLCIGERTCWRMAACGQLPKALSLGARAKRWRLADLERYLAALAESGARP